MVLYVMQVKVKLLVIISLCNHMMTNQDRISAKCVTSGLQQKDIWIVTQKYILERSVHVLGVINVLLLMSTWGFIWMFTAVNTSALSAESVSITITTWQYTDEFILERNRLSVLFVANDLRVLVVLLATAECTVGRNHSNVTSVTRCLVSMDF